jgi:hypothetical protein
MKLKGFLLLLFIKYFATTLHAQQKDFGTWNYFTFQYKINENFTAGFTEHILRYENASEWWLFIHDIFIRQQLSNKLSHELHLRWNMQKQRTNAFDDRAVVFYALNMKLKKRRWNFAMRTRWQGMSYGMHLNDAFKGPWFYHRLRFSFSRSINYHLKVGANAELFQPLNRPERGYIDQVRIGPSIHNRLNRNVSLEYFFQMQKQLNRNNPFTYYLLGIGCNFTL